MAIESVAAPTAAPYEGICESLESARSRATELLSHQHKESDPFERVSARCEGLRVIMTMASKEMGEGSLGDGAWQNLFYFVEQVTDDIQRDAELVWREGRELWLDGRTRKD